MRKVGAFFGLVGGLSMVSSETILTQSDFDNGAVIITEPGTYVFGEDVTFRPNFPGDDFDLDAMEAPELLLFPSEAQRDPLGGEYSSRAFSLGFFGALIIQTNDVVIDLDGHTFKQSELHALMQRFFALVEVASAPFPPATGPADFASDAFAFGHNITIQNGVLGVSAHHGVHCNNCEDIVLKDLEIEEFEVAGVSLNAAKGVELDSVVIHNSRRDVKWNGRLSQAIFVLQAFSVHIDPVIDLSDFPELDDIVDNLRLKQEILRDELKEAIQAELDGELSENSLFVTLTKGLPDGSLLAGVLIHPRVNVGDFQSELPPNGTVPEGDELIFETNDIVLKNVLVENLSLSVTEKTVLRTLSGEAVEESGYQAGGVVTDMVGAVFDVDSVRDMESEEFAYKANALADFQIAMAKLKFGLDEVLTEENLGRALNSAELSVKALTNRNGITQEIIEWSKGELTWFDLIFNPGYRLENNHDFMFHLNKGVIGVKIDQTTSVLLQDVIVRDLENHGREEDRSFFFRNVELVNTLDNAFDDTKDFDLSTVSFSTSEYLGFNVKGLSLAANIHVLGDLIVENLYSTVPNNVKAVDYVNINVDTTISLDSDPVKATSTLPGKLPFFPKIIEYIKLDEFNLGVCVLFVEDDVPVLFDFIAAHALVGSLGFTVLLLIICCCCLMKKGEDVRRTSAVLEAKEVKNGSRIGPLLSSFKIKIGKPNDETAEI